MDSASSARPTQGSKRAPRPAPFRAVFRAFCRQKFCPPREANPSLRFFFFLAAAVPAGTAQGFLSPGPGRSFLRAQIQTNTSLEQRGGCGPRARGLQFVKDGFPYTNVRQNVFCLE